jgi:hypothetical protein
MSDKNFALCFRNVMAGVWCGLQLRQTSVEAVGELRGSPALLFRTFCFAAAK